MLYLMLQTVTCFTLCYYAPYTTGASCITPHGSEMKHDYDSLGCMSEPNLHGVELMWPQCHLLFILLYSLLSCFYITRDYFIVLHDNQVYMCD